MNTQQHAGTSSTAHDSTQRSRKIPLIALALVSMLLSMHVSAASAPLQSGDDDGALSAKSRTGSRGAKLYAIDCGRVDMNDTDFLADDGSMKGVAGTSVVPCYVIRHRRGDLVWDTGLPETMRDQKTKPDADFKFNVGTAFVDQLKTIGLSPADIEYVSFSHLHFDHAGNANAFAASTWIVDHRELAVAFSDQAGDRGESAHYEKLRSAQKIIIGRDGPHDVFGDGSVVIHSAPGHSPGHSMLLVNTSHSGSVLLTGDLWILDESRQRRLVPIYNSSREQTLQSMDYAETLAKKTGAKIIRQHVPADFDALPKFPRALE